jgi:hypothetical protein
MSTLQSRWTASIRADVHIWAQQLCLDSDKGA